MADDFYKRHIRDAIQGMKHLALEERGAYNTIIDHMYLMGGPLLDIEKDIAGIMNCDVRTWRRIKKQLLSKGRIECVQLGQGLAIADARAGQELAKRDAARSQKVAAGHKGGKSSGQSRKINHLGEAETGSASPREEESRVEEMRESAASQIPADKYAFVGTYLKGISEDDVQAFVHGRGLSRARVLDELRKCDKWYVANPQAQKNNWFLSVGRWLDRVDPAKPAGGNVMTFRERDEKAQRDAYDDICRIAK